MVIDDDTNADKPNTGSLVTFGGIGVGGNAAIGGMAMVNGGAIMDGEVHIHSNLFIARARDDEGDGGGDGDGDGDPFKQLGLPTEPMLGVEGDAGVTGKVVVGESVHIKSTLDATSPTSGSATFNGGVGVGKNLHVGGSTNVEQDLFVKKTIHALGGIKYYSHDGENYLGGGQTLHTGGKLVVDEDKDGGTALEVCWWWWWRW